MDVITSLQGFFDQEEELNTTGSPTFDTINLTNNVSFNGEILPDSVLCANGQILKKTGFNNWDCAADDDTLYDDAWINQTIAVNISDNNDSVVNYVDSQDTIFNNSISDWSINTFVNLSGDTMTGDLGMNTNNITYQSGSLNITSNSTCVKIYGATSIMEVC